MRTKFRPCIDLHDGKVKQIVGGTLNNDSRDALKTNFVAEESSAFYASMYKRHDLKGGHVIKLGKNNDSAAIEALEAWPGGLQIGGGINIDNAQDWLNLGASKVIVTSWLFPDGQFNLDRLRKFSEQVGRENLVVDLSCRAKESSWVVAIDKWQTRTDFHVNQENMSMVAEYCSEFLIHAADVEGLCRGIDENLVQCLGKWSKIPCTYAGGAKSLSDLDLVNQLSNGSVDLTFGSSLDIFGGNQVQFEDTVRWNSSFP